METNMPAMELMEYSKNYYSDCYEDWLRQVRKAGEAIDGNTPIFQVSPKLPPDKSLYDIFLDHIPENVRQHYTCYNCRSFINKYGTCVTINPETYEIRSIFWDPDASEVSDTFRAAVAEMRRAVEDGWICGYVEEYGTIGHPQTGVWNHLASRFRPINKENRNSHAVDESHRLLISLVYGDKKNSVDRINPKSLKKAINLLLDDGLHGSDSVRPYAEWLYGILQASATTVAPFFHNRIWLEAFEHTEWCHIRGTVLMSLIEDIDAGYSDTVIKSRFESKMNPIYYQRPQGAPSKELVKKAEEFIEKNGYAESLPRRFARLDEIIDNAIWKPAPVAKETKDNAPKKSGIFASVVTREEIENGDTDDIEVQNIYDLPELQIVSFAKFQNSVLPRAKRLQCVLDFSWRYPFFAIVGPENMDAPPILQYDNEEKRNPYSFYTYNNPTLPAQWFDKPNGLKALSPLVKAIDVKAIFREPSNWGDEEGRYSHLSNAALFVLDGCVDSRTDSGLGLFPVVLKSGFHEYRSVIEAYSQTGLLGGRDEASACGILFGISFKDDPIHNSRCVKYLVTTEYGQSLYAIDRWE